jgi:hypothetical protein
LCIRFGDVIVLYHVISQIVMSLGIFEWIASISEFLPHAYWGKNNFLRDIIYISPEGIQKEFRSGSTFV